MADTSVDLLASLMMHGASAGVAGTARSSNKEVDVTLDIPGFENSLNNANQRQTKAATEIAVKDDGKSFQREVPESEVPKADAKIVQKLERAAEQPKEMEDEVSMDVMANVQQQIVSTVLQGLDIDMEQFQNVLQELGLNVSDLMDSSNLALVVQELEGNSSLVEVLTNTEFQTTMQEITVLTEEVATELGINAEDLKHLLQTMEQNPMTQTTDIPQEIPKMTMEQPMTEEALVDQGKQQSFAEQPLQQQVPQDVKPTEQVEMTNTVTTYETPEVAENMEAEITIENANQNLPEKPENPEVIVAEKTIEVETEEKAPTVVSEPEKENEEVITKDVANVKELIKDQVTSNNGNSEEDATEFDHFKKNDNGFEKKEPTQPHVAHENQVTTTQTVQTPQGTQVEQTVKVVDIKNLVSEIVEYVKVQATANDTTSLEMQLTPANLGRVLVEVESNRGEVATRIITQTEAAKEAIEANLTQFKQNLENQGVKVSAVEVTVSSHGFEHNLQQDGSKEQQQLAKEMKQQTKRMNLNLNEMTLEDLQGVMSDEDMIVAKMMKDNGNVLNIGV
ncbi:MAG: flagellar hook-length control protein FliK [Lachnospiraceae bacterium]|nr:flagellar hook-length control protein FliK [Lachnospiraceae bacterium]